jgi:hypothetical protein
MPTVTSANGGQGKSPFCLHPAVWLAGAWSLAGGFEYRYSYVAVRSPRLRLPVAKEIGRCTNRP